MCAMAEVKTGNPPYADFETIPQLCGNVSSCIEVAYLVDREESLATIHQLYSTIHRAPKVVMTSKGYVDERASIVNLHSTFALPLRTHVKLVCPRYDFH